MVGAERGWGTILRGSRRGRAAPAPRRGNGYNRGRGRAGFAGTTAGLCLAGMRLCRASSSSFCLLARMAFITSPGLEMWERSIFGVMPCGAREAEALRSGRLASSRAQNARAPYPPRNPPANWSGSCRSASPSSPNISRTWRLLISISRARSLIRTLLIRLFSKCASQRPLVAHSYLVAVAQIKLLIAPLVLKFAAHTTRRPLRHACSRLACFQSPASSASGTFFHGFFSRWN
jgi:hypothetical protein